MTFDEWVTLYEKKSHDKHVLPKGYTTLYDESRGYAQFKIECGSLWIYETCGEGKYWYDVGIKICRDNNIHKLITICTRNLLPYIRLFGGKITKKSVQPARHNGLFVEGINHLEKKFYCFPAWWDEEKQRNAYYIVNEV